MIKKEVYAFSSSFLLPADNRSQRETRRRKRRWSGGRSVPRPPTGSTAPYCDQAHHLHHLSHAHTRTHTNKPLDVRELPSSGQTTGAQKGLGVGWGMTRWIQEGWNWSEMLDSAPHDASDWALRLPPSLYGPFQRFFFFLWEPLPICTRPWNA